jgi:putative phosphoserine phosphatase/1-acylglycerol-3-phosphate O-acyltransferase
MWRNAKTTQSGTLQIVVHAPIQTTGWRREDLTDHVAAVRQLYVDTLEEWPGSAETLPPVAHLRPGRKPRAKSKSRARR